MNFDPQIFQLTKETQCIQRLGLQVPDIARQLCSREAHFHDSYIRLNNILSKKKQILERLPMNIRKSLAFHVERLGAALEPGLTALNW